MKIEYGLDGNGKPVPIAVAERQSLVRSGDPLGALARERSTFVGCLMESGILMDQAPRGITGQELMTALAQSI